MHKAIFLAAGLVLGSGGTMAVADDDVRPSADEMKRIGSALDALGCKGGDAEKETSGIFEIDDAQCKEGQMDVKLGTDYKLRAMTAD